MTSAKKFELFQKVLVPVVAGFPAEISLAAARMIAGAERLLLFGLVPVAENQSLSTGATRAQQLRRFLRTIPEVTLARTRVSYNPWHEVVNLIEEEQPDLLVLEWPSATHALGVNLEEILSHPPCDLCLVRAPLGRLKRILVPLRGGPYAELALRLALNSAHNVDAKLSSLHIRTPQVTSTTRQRKLALNQDAAFEGLSRVLDQLPEVNQRNVQTRDAAKTIIQASKKFDLVVMGASAQVRKTQDSFGQTAERVLHESKSGVIVVRTKRSMPARAITQSVGQKAISVLVDKWFAENTYHSDEFVDLKRLRRLKEAQGISISLAMPALNEEATVGKVIRTIKTALMDKAKIIDEIVLVDSGSTDKTMQIAADCGVPVYAQKDILPKHGVHKGKGEVLWKSLFVTRGDLVFWIDTDIVNINPGFVYGLIGPLLANPSLQFVKGFYRRPLRVGKKLQAGGGGRVTELTARPLLNLFYPELSGVVQPLSGEYGGRRSVLEKLSFFSGYGVETGLLIDIFEEYGLSAMGQVDLQQRIHHNQPLEALSMMSFAIIQVVIRKLEKRYGREILEDVNKSMKLIRFEDERFFLDVEEISELERPPMVSLPEYGKRRFRNLKGDRQV
ncbi:MAG: glucosyl-3-phosphoglycerate synthase [Anaerolineales bacterium]